MFGKDKYRFLEFVLYIRLAHAIKLAKTLSKDQIIVINLSGRGDKDVKHIAAYRGLKLVE